jgi:antitoxin CptB
MSEVTDLKQIYWRSRRGMLELELKLVPFVRDYYRDLSEAEKQTYEAMLAEEDWQLFDWLQGREVPEDELTGQVVEKIIASRGTI